MQNKLALFKSSKGQDSEGVSYAHGNAIFGKTVYYTRAFQYDKTLSTSTDTSMKTNKVIFVNSETVSKSFPNPVEKEKSVVFCTQAGDPTDVSKVAIFGEGDEYRDKLYGTQFK